MKWPKPFLDEARKLRKHVKKMFSYFNRKEALCLIPSLTGIERISYSLQNNWHMRLPPTRILKSWKQSGILNTKSLAARRKKRKQSTEYVINERRLLERTTNKWVRKMWFIHKMEYCSAVKKLWNSQKNEWS